MVLRGFRADPLVQLRGRLFGLHRQHHTTDDNIYWSFNVSDHFYFIFTTSLLMICVFQTFQALILQHFPCISDWVDVPTYNRDMSRATAFAPLKGN